jgi:signal transduction histidine kinase
MWYLAIAMTISIVFSFAIYNVATRDIDRGLNREQQRVELEFPNYIGYPSLRQLGNNTAGNERHDVLLRLVALNLFVLVAAGFVSYWLARRTLEPIEAAHEQQKRFTANVSHELRTPLTALRMESEVALLNSKATAKELRETLTSNLEEVTKLDLLINNLLRLSQLEADELQQQFQAVNGKVVAETAVKRIEKLAAGRHISIDKKIENCTVFGDEESLVQLIVILLDNAIKYSPAGKTIFLETSRRGDDVVWQIRDEGNGIPPADLANVFDRFYRADHSREKTSSGGYGLGLSIAKMIADVHNGTITLKSQVGRGTTALVLIPKADS